MKNVPLILLLFLLLAGFAKAQEANNWYFGQNAGLSFNTSPPSLLLDGQIVTIEGCTSISDSAGNLLFYSDGISVWNRNHAIMPNGTGLMGHQSSTHSAIAIPKSGSKNIYYLFTADAADNLYANGYRYSVIDMSLNGGLGDVTAVKNVLLYTPSTEKLAAAVHANGIDAWLITKDNNSYAYRAYKIDCNGLNTTPVISVPGPFYGVSPDYGIGCMKVSPDQQKIACASFFGAFWEICQFDNATGIISAKQTLNTSDGVYGIEFSPDSKLLYVSSPFLTQYKTDIMDSAIISNSKIDYGISISALQAGPDNKIYFTDFYDTAISVINNPNVYGAGCGINYHSLYLGGRHSASGLPTNFVKFVNAQPVDFASAFQPDCRTVIFSGNSNIPGIDTWQWDFGDGTTATGQTVSHYFPPVPDTFNITLTATNSSVCGGNSSRTRTINFTRISPVANFGFSTACGSKIVNFHDSSLIAAGAQIISWDWDFGDGQSYNGQNPIHNFNSYGTFAVRLVTTSNDGCNTKDTFVRTVIVPSKPVAGFTFAGSCISSPVNFTDVSSISSGNIIAWQWDFGDGQIATTQKPLHQYSVPGSYTVSLVVKSQYNCISDTLRKTVIIGAKPSLNFDKPSVCLLDAFASFVNTSTIADTSTLLYLWKFGDPNATLLNPNTSILQNPAHKYTAAANYTVELIGHTPLGCSDSVSKIITVNGAIPRAGFSVLNRNRLCSNEIVGIKDSSYVDFGNITKIKILWGDGDSTIDNSPGQLPNSKIYSHQYPLFGAPVSKIYTITMQASSGILCGNTYQTTVTVNASPSVLFGAIPDVCHESLPIVISQATEVYGLSGLGLYSGTGILNPSGLFDPHISDTGNHIIMYKFITDNGCQTVNSGVIHVNPTPVASFNYSHGCLPAAIINFTNTSMLPGSNASAIQYLWNFGDAAASVLNPNTSVATNPVHTYHSLDSFLVNLKATSSKGCTHDTAIKLYPNNAIFQQPRANFKIDSIKPICVGSPIGFINQSFDGGQAVSQYYWSFGDGNIASSISPIHSYQSFGNYTASLWLKNTKGCYSDTISKLISIHSIPIANFALDTACFGKIVHFTDQSKNDFGSITNWQWDLGNGITSAVQNPTNRYIDYKTFTVSLFVSTANGCTSSSPVTKSFSIKKVNVFAGNDTVIAKLQPLQLKATGTDYYSWTPSSGLSSSAISNPVAILSNNSQTYYITGTTKEGCTGFDTINIKVFDEADIYFPNTFTPNADGINDNFRPVLAGIKQFDYFMIYDRYGNRIFNSNNPSKGWDGSSQGVKAPQGSYVWIVRAIRFDGKILEKKGTVLLLR